jgi:hypothetical protein
MILTFHVGEAELLAATDALAAEYDAPAVAMRAAVVRWLQLQLREIVADLPYYLDGSDLWERELARACRERPTLEVRRRLWDLEIRWCAGGAVIEIAYVESARELERRIRATPRWQGVPLVMRYYDPCPME